MYAERYDLFDFAFNIHRTFCDAGCKDMLGFLNSQSAQPELVDLCACPDAACISCLRQIFADQIDDKLSPVFQSLVGMAFRSD